MHLGPSVEVHRYNLRYLGGRERFEASLDKKVREIPSQSIFQVWCHGYHPSYEGGHR
jgi:hypothetical protein